VPSWLLFVPCTIFFILIVHGYHLATLADCCIGFVLGLALNVIGVLQLIDWMADKDSKYVFSQGNLLPEDRAGA
jgi:hypothetical protein